MIIIVHWQLIVSHLTHRNYLSWFSIGWVRSGTPWSRDLAFLDYVICDGGVRILQLPVPNFTLSLYCTEEALVWCSLTKHHSKMQQIIALQHCRAIRCNSCCLLLGVGGCLLDCIAEIETMCTRWWPQSTASHHPLSRVKFITLVVIFSYHFNEERVLKCMEN